MEPIIGIYKITNKINGKSYVGQSVNIHQRWTTEKNASQNPNRHEYNYPLSKAFRKYGIVKTYDTCNSISRTAITHNVSIHYIKQILEKHRIKAKGRTVPKCVAMYENNQKLMCFTSANQAADYLKILGIENPSSSHIVSVCKGKRKNAYGYQWKYIDENEE